MGHQQGELPLCQQVHQKARPGLSGQEEVNFLLHPLGTAQLVLFQRLVELAVADRGIVEIGNGLMELLRRETGHHLLEAAKGLGALIKIRGGSGPLEADAVFNVVVHPPAVAVLILKPVLPVHGGDQAQRLHGMAHPLGRIPGHVPNVLHQIRYVGKYMPVDFLQLIHVAPTRDNAIGLVDMSKAVPLTGHRLALHAKCVYCLFHVVSSQPSAHWRRKMNIS